MSRSRAWVFTLNNYTSEDEENIKALSARYIVYGREVAPTTGTKHLQGYIYFNEAKTFSSIKKKLNPRAHLELAKGTAIENQKYCCKDKDFMEIGIMPDQHKKNKEITADTKYIECKSLNQWKWVLAQKALRIQPRTEMPNVHWYYGSSGAGKSHQAYSSADIYSKDETKWWDGYEGQDTIVIDDFEINEYWTWRKLLKVLDKYKMTVQTKGGYIELNSPNIIITSEHDPIMTCDCKTKNDKEQILRRIKVIKKFSFDELGNRKCLTEKPILGDDEFVKVDS